MQPDPNVFLSALRLELLRSDFFGSALEEGLSPIIVARGAEALAQLALRHASLPAIVSGVRDRQREVLTAAAGLVREAGIAVPDAAQKALAGDEPASGDIARYEALVAAVSACIEALSDIDPTNSDLGRKLAQVSASAAKIELTVRSEYKVSLQRLKDRDAKRIAAIDSAAPAPTDAEVTAFLRSRFPKSPDIEAQNVRRRPGVNTKEIFFLDVLHHAGLHGSMVLRREPRFNATQAPVAQEYALLEQLSLSGIKVPRVLALDSAGRLGGTSIIMERLDGATRLPEALGADGPPIADAIARLLAGIHRLDAKTLSAPHRHDGRTPARIMAALVDKCHRRWIADRIEPSATLEAAFQWLRSNLDALDDTVCLVHGDFNFRNILLNGADVSAILDWELAHAGHPAEDLAYLRPDIEKVVPWGDFLAAYWSHGGARVTSEALRFFQIWTDVWRMALAASVYTGFIRAEHKNFIVASVAFVEYYETLDPLCEFLSAAL